MREIREITARTREFRANGVSRRDPPLERLRSLSSLLEAPVVLAREDLFEVNEVTQG